MRQPPADAFPFTGMDGIDVKSMLKGAVASFDPAGIRAAVHDCFKRVVSGAGGRVGAQVPHEWRYHFELFAVLRAWAPAHVQLSAEVKRGLSSNQRCDLEIGASGQRVLLELMATGTDAQVEEHYKRAAEYRVAINAHSVWLVHFVATGQRNFPQPPDGVQAAHICHDKAFEHVTILFPNALCSGWVSSVIL
jgi:hypothetical protein